MLNFIVPVRHHATMPDWDFVQTLIGQTIDSFYAQTATDWRAIIVANRETPLPRLGSKVDRVDVDLAPIMLDQHIGKPQRVELVRLDKGRRVLAGLQKILNNEYIMIVDYDDLISRNLANFLNKNDNENGWYCDSGFLFDGGKIISFYPYRFNFLCGTSHIIKNKNIEMLKNEFDEEYFMKFFLGSHTSIKETLDEKGKPLAALPFAAVAYRVGYRGATSRTSGLRQFYWPHGVWRTPIRAVRKIGRLRWRGRRFDREFLGADLDRCTLTPEL